MDAGGSQKTKPRSPLQAVSLHESLLRRPFRAASGVFPLYSFRFVSMPHRTAKIILLDALNR